MDKGAADLSANCQFTEKSGKSRSSGQGRCRGKDSVESESQAAFGCSDRVVVAGGALTS